jgi:hypothetical protein
MSLIGSPGATSGMMYVGGGAEDVVVDVVDDGATVAVAG